MSLKFNFERGYACSIERISKIIEKKGFNDIIITCLNSISRKKKSIFFVMG